MAEPVNTRARIQTRSTTNLWLGPHGVLDSEMAGFRDPWHLVLPSAARHGTQMSLRSACARSKERERQGQIHRKDLGECLLGVLLAGQEGHSGEGTVMCKDKGASAH